MSGLKGVSGTPDASVRQRRNWQKLYASFSSMLGVGLLLVDGLIIVDDTVYLPYTGATANVDLGSKTLTTTGMGTFGNAIINGNITLENGAIISESTNNVIKVTSDSTGGYTTWFGIDTDDSTYGPTIFGGTDRSGSEIIFVRGTLSARDDSKFSLGNGGDFGIRWDTNGNDWTRLDIRTGSSSGSGNLVLTDRTVFPTTGYPIETNPKLRIQAASTTIAKYIGFQHDGTDGIIDTGAGDLKLNPSGDVNLIDNNLVTTGTIQASGKMRIPVSGSSSDGYLSAGILDELKLYNTGSSSYIDSSDTFIIRSVKASGSITIIAGASTGVAIGGSAYFYGGSGYASATIGSAGGNSVFYGGTGGSGDNTGGVGGRGEIIGGTGGTYTADAGTGGKGGDSRIRGGLGGSPDLTQSGTGGDGGDVLVVGGIPGTGDVANGSPGNVLIGTIYTSLIRLGTDNIKTYFGTGSDASITYDGTDLRISSHEVGDGHIILDSPKTTTGDPAGVEGKIYWNTFDNVIKMYADGAWRTLVSW